NKKFGHRLRRIRGDLLKDMWEPVVYAIEAPIVPGFKFVKIGYTTGLVARMEDIQTGCPVRIGDVSYVRAMSVEKARNIEAALHLVLGEVRSSGEWFRFDMSNERHQKLWRGAFPAVLNEAFGKGRWKIKRFKNPDAD